ncbi:MAG: hypothetical protein P1P64_04665 [Treponemataceae bacterium]
MKKNILMLFLLLSLSVNVYSENEEQYDVYFQSSESGATLKLSSEEKNIVKKYLAKDTDKKELMKCLCRYRLIVVDEKNISYYKTNCSYLAEVGNDLYIKLGKDMFFFKLC